MVSVIIPNKNASFWLPLTITSCLVQGEEWVKEVIIIDDHSTDESWDLLTDIQLRFPKQVKIFKNPGKGANAARNYGFQQATGKYIQWLDADDQLMPGKWAAQLAAFRADPTLDIVLSDWLIDVYESEKRIKRIEKVKHPIPDFLAEILRDNWSVPANYLLTRAVAERLHRQDAWNENRLINQDREYFTQAGLLGARAGYVAGFYSIYNIWSTENIRNRHIDRKYQSIVDILLRARDQIISAKRFSPTRRHTYLRIINAQLLDAIYYQRDLTIPYSIGLRKIDWRSGGKAKLRWGINTRYRLLRAWLWHRFRI